MVILVLNGIIKIKKCRDIRNKIEFIIKGYNWLCCIFFLEFVLVVKEMCLSDIILGKI